jgi:translation initiation factor IF-3
MPTLEGKRMTMFIAPKKVVAKPMKTAEELENEKAPEEVIVKKQPQQKARKEYTGPKVEGEDFDD